MASTLPSRSSLSVVLITHNAAEQLARTLDAVSWADEILVVDSGSTDGTAEAARAALTRGRVIANPENSGYAKAANLGLAAFAMVLRRLRHPGEKGLAGVRCLG